MLKLLPFQEIGRDFLASRTNAILADDMGLGKTYQAIEAIKLLQLQSGIVVCPQSIRRSWVKRIREQMPNAFIKEIVTPKTHPDVMAINVVNYDIVWREPVFSRLMAEDWPFLICDESHYLKNAESKRTQYVLGKKGLVKKCARRWLMTGTPILNRPIELYPTLRALFPQSLGRYQGYYDFAYKFCDGHQGPFGFDATGCSAMEELSLMLKPLMLRRLKAEVQKDLPQVTYDKVYLDPSDQLIALTEKENVHFDAKQTIGEISSIRRALGVIKAAAAIAHIKDLFEEKKKVVAFTFHHDVADLLAVAFKDVSVVYTGQQSATEKQNALDRFCTDGQTRLFIGQINAAGIGIDGLQKVCDTCVFVEMSYVPGEVQQAVDRLARMGQTKPVQAQFLIAENSMDEKVVNTLAEKAKNIRTILDEKGGNNFTQTKCALCKRETEISKTTRVLGRTVCPLCKKEMEFIL